jgi:molybdopterin converting factor small subunit
MKIKIVLTGRSYHLASQLPDEVTLADGATLQDAIRAIPDSLSDEHALPDTCLVTVSGEHLGTLNHHRERTLQDGEEIVLIAPVAGG